MKLFTCEVLTEAGNLISLYFEEGKVVAEGAGKKIDVVSANKYAKTITIRKDGKEGIIRLKKGAAHAETMMAAVYKPGRQLYMFNSDDLAWEASKTVEFGSRFESVDSSNDRIECAYKYAK